MFAMSWATCPTGIHTDVRRFTIVKVSPLTIALSRYPRRQGIIPRTPDSIATKADNLRSSHRQHLETRNLPGRRGL
jgi:hypothetical protein